MARKRERHAFSHSSRIETGWYDAAAETVELEFPDGVHWYYFEVSYGTWDRLKRSGSPGRFLADILDRHPNRAK